MSLVVALLLSASPPVTLTADSCDAAFVELVRAELSLAGMPAAVVAGSAAPGQELAQLQLACDATGVDVLLEDHVTSKRVERRILRSSEPRGDNRAAVQVVELLHASLAEARLRPEKRIPLEVEKFLEKREPTPEPPWRVGVQAGLAVAPGGFGAQPLVAASLARRVGAVEPSVAFGATVRATTVHGLGGSADLGLVDARVAVALPIALRAVVLRPSLGLGALLGWAAGHPDAGYDARSGVAATFAPSAGIAVELALTSSVALAGSAQLALAPVPIQVRFPDGVAAQIGLPVVSVAVGVVIQ